MHDFILVLLDITAALKVYKSIALLRGIQYFEVFFCFAKALKGVDGNKINN